MSRAGTVAAVSCSPKHSIVKQPRDAIRLIAGEGVAGDAHAGARVKHRFLARRNPAAPNLRQVHLLPAELHEELRAAGFVIAPGEMGENVTTRGMDLIGLPRGALLHLGSEAVVEVTGLRSPCRLLDRIAPGLMAATLGRDAEGRLLRKAGVMAVVRAGGEIRPEDPIRVTLPPAPHRPLEPV